MLSLLNKALWQRTSVSLVVINSALSFRINSLTTKWNTIGGRTRIGSCWHKVSGWSRFIIFLWSSNRRNWWMGLRFYMRSNPWIHMSHESFMYLSLPESYHGVRANWTSIQREYKYHIKESDPSFLLRLCTHQSDKAVTSPPTDRRSWIYDLKMHFYMKRGGQIFPLKLLEFDMMKENRANLRCCCFSYLLFISPCFPLSLNPPSRTIWGKFDIYTLILIRKGTLWQDNVLQLMLWAHWLSSQG